MNVITFSFYLVNTYFHICITLFIIFLQMQLLLDLFFVNNHIRFSSSMQKIRFFALLHLTHFNLCIIMYSVHILNSDIFYKI